MHLESRATAVYEKNPSIAPLKTASLKKNCSLAVVARSVSYRVFSVRDGQTGDRQRISR